MSDIADNIVDIPLIDIEGVGTSQARQRDNIVEEEDDIVHSIRKIGLIHPIIVQKQHNGKYLVISGQRRFRAHKILNKPTIKARILAENTDEFTAKKVSLLENTARKEMKRQDYVDAIDIFYKKYGTIAAVAEELGLSRSTVKNYLGYAALPPEIKKAVDSNIINQGDALNAFKALDDGTPNVDVNRVVETAKIMKQKSAPAKNKILYITKNEPNMSSENVKQYVEKPKDMIKFQVEVTPDLHTQIQSWGKKHDQEKIEDAAQDLIYLGLKSDDHVHT